MPGVYLMPNGQVASVDLGDGRRSLVSRAKFEECCCPFCGDGLDRPNQILLESGSHLEKNYRDDNCTDFSSAVEVRLKHPIVLNYAPAFGILCRWIKNTTTDFERRFDSGDGFGPWSDYSGQAQVMFSETFKDWSANLFFYPLGRKATGSSPIGSYSRNTSCTRVSSSHYFTHNNSATVS
jgi:hypothetical protein